MRRINMFTFALGMCLCLTMVSGAQEDAASLEDAGVTVIVAGAVCAYPQSSTTERRV